MHLNRLDLPVRKRRVSFTLTSLADVMFQLLVFFMLSSSLTPYALLPLQHTDPVSDQRVGTGAGAADPVAAQPGGATSAPLWNLDADALNIQGQRFDFSALPDLAAALGSDGGPASVILIVRASARVQDVATVLAHLQAADVTAVQISAGGL
ncbi:MULTISPECIES: ExbD/TolR family protein [unclassified Epibacterium]|jgi:biopolymer transport protein ExbD|uniref:ExbD/TolR family protein n=1 Tax=unclassified Epibacterium TaxID=2639179 RepID=UPI001EF6EB97|nr:MULTISPECIES: biopolymer transporter ExbD [unclassified Epibacterium]MCG7625010.1 biopolymer transporter ExbD [Epibacterium sp. Ofav1-8]MCG7630483.1 biopolymer transporter ExbD [Epibacterium sp. MM17-32]